MTVWGSAESNLIGLKTVHFKDMKKVSFPNVADIGKIFIHNLLHRTPLLANFGLPLGQS